jgi:hypothetical protein
MIPYCKQTVFPTIPLFKGKPIENIQHLYQVLRFRIRIILGNRIGSATERKVKKWIRIRIQAKIQELWRLRMDPRKAVDALNGDVDAQNGVMEAGGRDESDPDPH